MSNNFENEVLKRLANIEDLMLFRYKNENSLLVKQEAKFKLKTDEIGKMFFDMFLKCDTQEQALWVKNTLIKIIEKQYNTEKEFREMFIK